MGDIKLQIIFAYKTDKYYTESLMELDRTQYLWLSLRKEYTNVWFILTQKDGSIDVRSYDYAQKSGINLISTRTSFFQKNKKPLQWLKKQSDQGGKQAFVMNKESYSFFFTDSGDLSNFQDISIFLLLEPEMTLLKELINGSIPYVEKSKVKSIIDDIMERDIYKNGNVLRGMHLHYGDEFCFYHLFTKEKIKNLLMYIIFDEKNKNNNRKLVILEHMAVYLTQYLNNNCMQWEDNGKLFGEVIRTDSLKYVELKEKLLKKEVWKRLVERAEQLYTINSDDAEEAIKIYLDKKGIGYANDIMVFMKLDSASAENYCIPFLPVRRGQAIDTIPENIKEIVLKHYEDLIVTLFDIGNQKENELYRSKFEELVQNFDCSISSVEKYYRYLICVDICMCLRYEKNINLERFMKLIYDYMDVVNTLYDISDDWDVETRKQQFNYLSDIDKNVFADEIDYNKIEKSIKLFREHTVTKILNKNVSVEDTFAWKSMSMHQDFEPPFEETYLPDRDLFSLPDVSKKKKPK